MPRRIVLVAYEADGDGMTGPPLMHDAEAVAAVAEATGLTPDHAEIAIFTITI